MDGYTLLSSKANPVFLAFTTTGTRSAPTSRPTKRSGLSGWEKGHSNSKRTFLHFNFFFCFGFIKFKRWSHSTQPFSHSFFQSIKCSSIQGDVRQLENRQVFNGKVLQAYSRVVLLWIWALLICICPPLSFCNLLTIVTVRSSKQYSMYSASFGVQTKNVLTG